MYFHALCLSQNGYGTASCLSIVLLLLLPAVVLVLALVLVFVLVHGAAQAIIPTNPQDVTQSALVSKRATTRMTQS